MKTKKILLPILIILLTGVLSSCSNNSNENLTKEEATNIEIVKKFSEAMNNVDYDVFKEILDTNAVWYYRDKEMPNTPESERKIQSNWKSALPDMNYGIEKIFAQKDQVAVLYNYTGTHEDTLLGYPPTGNKISVGKMVIYRLKNKRKVETWVVFDEHLLRKQLSKKMITKTIVHYLNIKRSI